MGETGGAAYFFMYLESLRDFEKYTDD